MKNKKVLIGVLILVIAILVAVIVYLLVGQKRPTTEVESGSGVSGMISAGWDSGINTGGVESSETQVPGYKDAQMNEGDTTLHLNIGNPQVNEVGFLATVELEDGTVLYESPLLEPGYGIQEIPLNQTLAKGEYNAYVVYHIVSLDETHAPMNTVKSAFKLYVE